MDRGQIDIGEFIPECICKTSLGFAFPSVTWVLFIPECIRNNLPNHQGRRSEADVLSGDRSGLLPSSSCQVRVACAKAIIELRLTKMQHLEFQIYCFVCYAVVHFIVICRCNLVAIFAVTGHL